MSAMVTPIRFMFRYDNSTHRKNCDCQYCALDRLTKAARIVAAILDAGKRDPRWPEQVELEEAAIAYGRAVTASKRRKR